MNLLTPFNLNPAPAGFFIFIDGSNRRLFFHTLAKKLGIKEDYTIRLINAPANYFQLFSDWPGTAKLANDKASKKDFIHFFSTEATELCSQLPCLQNEIKQTGIIGVSWPKKAAK